MTDRSVRRRLPLQSRRWVLLAILLAAGCAGDAPEPRDRNAPEAPATTGAAPDSPAPMVPTRRFEGAWFSVSYPENFTVRPSLESDSAEGYDSAFFDSPDGEVTFYAHVPQWGGEPEDIALDPATEELLASSSSTEGPITTTRITMTALDGSWERTYVTESDARGPSQWTIGWRYTSDEARERHASAFEAFRASLMRFGS